MVLSALLVMVLVCFQSFFVVFFTIYIMKITYKEISEVCMCVCARGGLGCSNLSAADYQTHGFIFCTKYRLH